MAAKESRAPTLDYWKLFQCVETYCSPAGKTNGCSKRTPFFRCKPENGLENGTLFGTFSLCGFIGNRGKIDTAEEVLHNVALAAMALKDGDIEKSEEMFAETLDIAETNDFSSTVISTCDILSSLAMKLGDYEKAEDFLIKALNKLLSQGAPEDNNAVIGFNLKLSKLYSRNGNDSLAEMGFKNCIKLQEDKIQNDAADEDAILLWVTTLYWYGKFLLGKNRYREAKCCFRDSYRAADKTDTLSPGQVTVILYNLGEVCRLLGEHDDAAEHLLRGASLAEKSKNPDLPYFYNKLGEISFSKKLYEDARIWCDAAKKFSIRNRDREAEIESKQCLEKLNNFLLT